MTDLTRIINFLDEAQTYYLATAEGDQPRVRPFGTALVSKQLNANPKAEICAFLNGTWLRISGELINDDRYEAKKAMLDKYPDLRSMYSAEDDNTQVLYFKNATAVFSSFTSAPETLQF